MTTATLKPSTQIKKIMASYVAVLGYTNKQAVEKDGITYYTFAATRLCVVSQIKIIHPELGVWIADTNKAGVLGAPKQIRQMSTGAWELVK